MYGVYEALQGCREPRFWELSKRDSLKGCLCTC